MKNKAIGRYALLLAAFTGGYVLLLIVLDEVFNGVVLDLLSRFFKLGDVFMISRKRTELMLLVYIVGLGAISFFSVLRLGRLLRLASDALVEEWSEILEGDCPLELQEFSQRLKDFRLALRETEHARQQAEQQKNDLIVYLAHDLKTPLTSVIGYLSLLEEASELPVQQRAKYTGIALDKAYRLEQLINEFFDITRENLHMSSVQKAKTNLTILLNQIIDEFYPMVEQKHICLEAQIQPELIVQADVDKLARVMDNLFRNAVSYSHEGTMILCRAYRQAGSVVIRLRNTGEDIPPEKLARIFEKFYRADSARRTGTGGAGLGLAIAKQIVELHGGSISATCTDGVTEFWVELPM